MPTNLDIKNQQLKVLKRILKNADESEFAANYKFSSWINEKGLYTSFVSEIPVFDYDTFYEAWVRKALTSGESILFNNKFKYLAITSGTGKMLGKHLPYSQEFIKSTLRSSGSMVFKMIRMGISPFLFIKNVLTVGGSTTFTQNNHILTSNSYNPELTAGFMSGIGFKESPKWFSFLSRPGHEVHAITDWKQKMDIIVNEAPTYKIGTLTGFPSYVLPLLRAIIKKYNLSTIHDIWPEFKLYIHSGVSIEHYRTGLNDCFGKKVDLFETYFATEGFFGHSVELNNPTMQLIINTNIFYEFVEVNNQNFDSNNVINNGAVIIPLWEVKTEKEYALLVTNNSGLYRFIQGDVLIFSDVEKCHFKLSGRLSEMVNLSGEIVTLSHYTTLFMEYCKLKDLTDITDYFIATEIEAGVSNYNWFIVSDKLKNNDFNDLDKYLMDHLVLYNNYRKDGLTSVCRIQIIPEFKYEQFLYLTNKKNGQSKMPKYLKGDLKVKFDQFMASTSE